MKNFLVALSMVLGGYVSSQTYPLKTAEDLFDQTVLLRSYYFNPMDPDEEYSGTCAGVWIGNKHILTAAHCVSEYDINNDKVFLLRDTFIYNKHLASTESLGYKAAIVSVNITCDLAVIGMIDHLDFNHPIVEIRNHDLNIAELVQGVGHPGDQSWIYTSGQVSSLEQYHEIHGSFNLININVGHGYSGGGLFDSQNKLVGISRAILHAGKMQLSMFSTQNCIKSIINESKNVINNKKMVW